MTGDLKKPVIKKCRRHEKYDKPCHNTNLFLAIPRKNHDGRIVEWEIECMSCGFIWWVKDQVDLDTPKLYKKDNALVQEKPKKKKKKKRL